jgi:hypothetical protein
MSRRAVSGRALNEHLLYYFGTGGGLRFASTGAPAETFHLLTESGVDRFLTEAGDFLDIEHV